MHRAAALSPSDLSAARSPRARFGRLARACAFEARCEFLALCRQPGFTVPALTFPVFFYLVFGVLLAGGRYTPHGMPAYLIATYAAFGVINTGLHAFGMGVAMDRGLGWLTLKRASPMPPFAYFAAKLASSLAFGLLTFLLLAAMGVTLAGVRFPTATWLALGATLMLGSVPFAAMGVAVGYLASPRSVGGLVTMIQLPWALGSGLWIPIDVMPDWWQRAAIALPPYHYAQLVLGFIGADRGTPPWIHVVALAAFMAACLAVARIAYQRWEDR
jgi:ABC-2 type transport system permease protein